MSESPERKSPIAAGNLVLALMFAVVGITGLLGGQVQGGLGWLSLMVGSLLLGSTDTPWARLPLWRRLIGGACVAMGTLLVVLLVLSGLGA